MQRSEGGGRKEYSAERMACAILGAQPLDELQQWAEDLLSKIPSGCGPPARFAQAGFPYEVSSCACFCVSPYDTCRMGLAFFHF